ncbi:MAG: glycosyltransferase [Stellaceae bacterium]|jgi:glycosyltransferase involved in cell wall biosynthesis
MTAGGVVHVITGLEIGGAEMLLLELCREDMRRGRDCSVASLISEGPMRDRFAQIGVEVTGLDMKRGEFSAPRLGRLVRLVRRIRPRIVQGWLYHANLAATAAARLAAVFPRPRLAWSIHGALPEFACYPPRLRRAVDLGARLSPFADGILYNGRAALDGHRRFGFRAPLARLFSNGVDLTRFGSAPDLRAATRRELGLPEDAVVAIAVGRDDPMKNWPGMLAAADAPADRNVWLVAVGDGTERLPPAPRRRLLGRRDDMPALYAAADIFMLASHFGEGTSVALSEAMASGLPVVVTAVGDNGAVVGEAGLVVPPRDGAALARALSTLAGDPALRASTGRAAQAAALTRFGIDRLHASFADFYAELLGEPRLGNREAA